MPGESAPLIAPGSEMSGGMPIPSLANTVTPGERPMTLYNGEGAVTGPQVPGGGPIIAVNTRAEDFMADGIIPGGGFGMGRQPRRNPYRSFGGMGMSPMMPSVSRYTPMEGGAAMPSSVSSGAQITINKME
jgi:hypothetical protein